MRAIPELGLMVKLPLLHGSSSICEPAQVSPPSVPVSAPELPADEALQGRVALVHQRAPATAASGHGIAERLWLPVVEDVTLAVVGRRAAGGLVAELRAPLDRQRLKL